MISYRNADILKQFRKPIECLIVICYTAQGTYYYEVQPVVGFDFSATKPLQEQIDAWFADYHDGCEKVEVGWRSPDVDNKITMDLISLLKKNPKISKIEYKELPGKSVHLNFQYKP